VIEFTSNYSDACGAVTLLESTSSSARVIVPRSRLFNSPTPIGTGGKSSLTAKPAPVAFFTGSHKGISLSLATAGVAGSFVFLTRDEFYNERKDQSVSADCVADADCTLAVRIIPSDPAASQANRALGGVIALQSVNSFFDVTYTATASGTYTLSIAAVHRLSSGESR
jgi:hypothetical protein